MAPCWAIWPLILVVLEREKMIPTTRVREATEPC